MRLIVNPHKIEIIKDELVNEREIDISKCTFEFAEEITQEYVKEAYFTYNDETYKQIINNNECAFPNEVLEQKGMVEIGVVAYLVENEQEIKRYNPSPAYFNTIIGSLKDNAENSEPITPSEMEQFEQQLQNGLNSIDDKLDEVDTKLETVDTKIDEIDTAIEETNNLDLDVNKQDNKTTVTLTKKNGSTKSVDVLDGTDGQDGTSLEFMWQGTSLGIKTDDMQDYVFVDLQGVQGPIGETGEPFTIKKTYSSIAEMNADFDNMNLGDYVMIASSVEIEDNAKLFTKGESAWIFITDFSGAMGIRGETGLTPNIQIGTVVTGETSSVTRTGTNENPIFNFVLEKGETGAIGSTGPQGETGNGISNIAKTSTSGLTDTYTITYTNGNTSTFTVTNGKGISSIVKTSTSGLVDTYTVTFNDNTTMTYTVTNGKDGVDGEVTQEQLDKVIKDLEYWKTTSNALPKVEGEGTDITLDNTADSPLTLGFKASESTQESTTGKNLLLNEATSQTINGITFTINSDKTIKVNGAATEQAQITVGTVDLIANTTYILTGTPTGLNNNAFLSILGYGNDFGTGVSYTPSQNETKTIILRVLNSTNMSNKVFKPMVRLSTVTDDTYEPYTNGASPNPDYPQDIHVLKGDNEVDVGNKSLYSYNSTQTINGITLTNNDNKSIDLSGTNAGARFNFGVTNIPIENIDRTKKYTFISNMPTNKFSLSVAEYNGTTWVRTLGSLGSGVTKIEITPSNDTSITKIGIALFIDANATLDISNLKFAFVEKIQNYPLNLGVENLFENVVYKNNYFIGSSGEEVSNSNACIWEKIKVKPNTTYTLSYESSDYSFGQRIAEYNASNVFIQRNITYSSSYTFTTSSTTEYINLSGLKTDNNIQIEGIPTELCNINNYADEFFKNVPECEYYDNTLEIGKWYKYGRIGKFVYNGEGSINQPATNYYNISGLNYMGYIVDSNISNNLCNRYITKPSYSSDSQFQSNTSDIDFACGLHPNNTGIRFKDTRGLSLNDFKNYLVGTIFYYPLQTPTKTLLSDTLQQQLDNISYAMAYQDQTNISQINEDKPFVISASTVKDMKTLEDRITALEESISL